jgi:hypothetical protein
VIVPVALALFGLIYADVAAAAAADNGNGAAKVVVALPANASRAILEALNRLRGEAISVGFEVRFVDASAEFNSLEQLDDLSLGLKPSAVVAFSGPKDSAQAPYSLDVWFMDRASGKISVAHLTAEGESDIEDRGDVIIAVRAVDFIRARMFDSLAGRRAATPKPQQASPSPSMKRKYVAAGVGVFSSFAGFKHSLAPQLELGYSITSWARVGANAFGLGTRPRVVDSNVGQVSLDQRFLGLSLTLQSRVWHRLQGLGEVGCGEYRVLVHGSANPPNTGKNATLSSLSALVSAGMALDLLSNVALDLRVGTLWLQDKPKIYSTESTYLGSVGRPTWFASLRVGVSF